MIADAPTEIADLINGLNAGISALEAIVFVLEAERDAARWIVDGLTDHMDPDELQKLWDAARVEVGLLGAAESGEST